ncbi:hypothetical protein D3C87_1558100 [compost metagenome]
MFLAGVIYCARLKSRMLSPAFGALSSGEEKLKAFGSRIEVISNSGLIRPSFAPPSRINGAQAKFAVNLLERGSNASKGMET